MVGAMDTNGYVAFLILGVVLVVIDGLIVYRSGRSYLDDAYRDPTASRSMVQLVTVLFHLMGLGLLAVISIINIDTGNPVRDVVVKLGVMLLVLGAAHAATITILSRLRDRLREDRITDELVEQGGAVATPEQDHQPIWNAVDPQSATGRPVVSPPIEENPNPYSATG
jgi:hypothetical protein